MNLSQPLTIRIFKYRFHIVEFLVLVFLYFFNEGIFSWLILPNSDLYEKATKVISLLIYGYVLFSFPKLKRDEKVFTVLFTLLMVKLVFESLYQYGSFFNQLTIFSVIYPVVYVVFIKAVARSLDFDILELLAKFYLITYLIFMAIYGHGFGFSLDQVEMDDYGPFSGDSRVIHARSILMIIIPYLWYLSKYIQKRKIVDLLLFLLCFVIILIHQHRSVWSCAIFSTFLFIVLTIRNNRKTTSRFFTLFTSFIVLGAFAIVYLSALKPGFLDFLGSRFSEILDPDREGGTGSFRIDQSVVYGEMIKQKPFLGWSFSGFYVRNPLVDWWEEGSGQHFHEGFIEILFYHGIVGLILKYSFFVIIAVKAFVRKLSQESIILVSFCLTGLVFSLSYVLPVVFFGHIGLCLYYLEKKNKSKDLQLSHAAE